MLLFALLDSLNQSAWLVSAGDGEVESKCLDADLKRDVAGLQEYVFSSQFDCAHEVIRHAHKTQGKEKEEIFYATRSAVTQLKKQADGMLRMLDVRYARPKPISCAFEARQNSTHIMATMRFAEIWEGQHGKWTRYNMDGGQGKIENIDPLPFEVPLTIDYDRVNMKIIGEVLNYRYEYNFNHKLFGEVIPEESSAIVTYRDISGSMQMSAGASLPEVQWTLKKKTPKAWLRFKSRVDENYEHPAWVGDETDPAPDWMQEEM